MSRQWLTEEEKDEIRTRCESAGWYTTVGKRDILRLLRALEAVERRSLRWEELHNEECEWGESLVALLQKTLPIITLHEPDLVDEVETMLEKA